MATLVPGRLSTPLRGHQDLALDACATHFAKGAPRVSVLMATGSGKTLVALNTVHEVAPRGSALVVVPTLQLLEQTAGHWRKEGRDGLYVGFCSRNAPQGQTLSGHLVMTNDPGHLADIAAEAPGSLNVFCTYSSLSRCF